MTAAIDLSLEEALALTRTAMEMHGGSFDAFNTNTQVAAAQGAIGIVRALQTLGYRISRSLKAVP